MMTKLLNVGPVVLSMLCIIWALSGCRSYVAAYNEAFYKGRSSTSSENNTPEKVFVETLRSFPADIDEVQYSVFGTNGWMRVQLYPDGMPYRVSRGEMTKNGERGNLLTEMEFDVYGNVISKYPVWPEKIPGYSLVPPVKPSKYWKDGPRVIRLASELTLDYYIGACYYQASDTNLEFCAWTIDRENKQMDKLVFTIRLENGLPVFKPEIKSHEGSLTELAEVVDLGDDRIGIAWKLHIKGKTISVKSRILPGGMTLAF